MENGNSYNGKLATGFYGKTTPAELVAQYGSPLYVYNEEILRRRCRELKNLSTYPNFVVNYSAKANCNIALLSILREEGTHIDAMSPGEIYAELKAGFLPEQILFITNNVSEEEMRYGIEQGVTISVDSLSQLEMYGKLNPKGKVAVRFNPGVGAGHHEKVVTGGKKTKFGVEARFVPQVKEILQRYQLTLVGINQHIGSLFMEGQAYIEGIKAILAIAQEFPELSFIDFGGGFGIPYRKIEGEKRLDLEALGRQLDQVIENWMKEYGRQITCKVEPGRYMVAECGVLLGSVHAVKMNYDRKYIGTDIGFNVLMRPVLYEAHHDIEVYPAKKRNELVMEEVTVVGNICETGDMLAENRLLPAVQEGDVIGVMDAGAYGYVMSSNYNHRLRPAEVLIGVDGTPRLIRRRDTLEDLLRNYEGVSE